MTNFEYIMNKMTDRDLADFIECGFFSAGNGSSLGEKAYNAYSNWVDSLAGCGGNMYFIDDTEHQPNVFQTANLHFYKGTRAEHKKMPVAEIANSKNCNKYAMPRKTNLSIQVWLSKQYNPAEWEEDNE